MNVNNEDTLVLCQSFKSERMLSRISNQKKAQNPLFVELVDDPMSPKLKGIFGGHYTALKFQWYYHWNSNDKKLCPITKTLYMQHMFRSYDAHVFSSLMCPCLAKRRTVSNASSHSLLTCPCSVKFFITSLSKCQQGQRDIPRWMLVKAEKDSSVPPAWLMLGACLHSQQAAHQLEQSDSGRSCHLISSSSPSSSSSRAATLSQRSPLLSPPPRSLSSSLPRPRPVIAREQKFAIGSLEMH